MTRLVPLAFGSAALGAAWLGPLPDLVHRSFTAHMTMHVLVVACAAPLLAAALAGTRFDPSVRVSWAFAPLPASLLEWLVVWGWHAPGMHMLAQHSSGALVLEQGSFLATALLLWIGALGGDRRKADGQAAAGVVGLLLTSMHMTLLGALLALAPRLLYGHGTLADQQTGGLVMLAAGGSAYLIGGLVLMARLLRARLAATAEAAT